MQLVSSKCVAVAVYFNPFYSNSFRGSFFVFNVPANEVLYRQKIKLYHAQDMLCFLNGSQLISVI